jgi:argininosuccinate lyase
MTLYHGRLPGGLDPLAAQLNDSLPFDRALAQEDVRGSLAWAKGLAQAGVLTEAELSAITAGLSQIQVEFSSAAFAFQESDEDIHTAVERRLVELAGPVGGKLHTGRSRNDQVATDFRLWVVNAAHRLETHLVALQQILATRAEQDFGVVLPGYTHTRQAQPVLLSHWWLSHFWALQRDQQRLTELRQRTRIMPLGCGALAGTTFPIDRFGLAQELDFLSPSPNSLDAISDRDFAAEFLFWAALLGVHLSRLSEALIWYSSQEFGFITLADAYSTGSSLMPQKKNPDPLELARAKSGLLTGKLAGLLATLKALPSAYDKDLQEDKVPVFEASAILEVLLPVVGGVIATLTLHPERMRAVIDAQVLATDLADYLVQRGVPFRQAHGAVGQAVRRAEALGIPLPALPLGEWQAIHPAFASDLFNTFDIDQSLARRSAWGGTAPQAVREQLEMVKGIISNYHPPD